MGAGNDATATGGGGTTQNLFETFTIDTGQQQRLLQMTHLIL